MHIEVWSRDTELVSKVRLCAGMFHTQSPYDVDPVLLEAMRMYRGFAAALKVKVDHE